MDKNLQKLIEFYNYPTLDWLNFIVSPDNKLTYHHILKKEHGGLKDISNGALLTIYGHNYLHIIESRAKYKYEYLNEMFKMFYKQGTGPTLEQRLYIELILEDFEKYYQNSSNAKGEKLIKDEFIKRRTLIFK